MSRNRRRSIPLYVNDRGTQRFIPIIFRGKGEGTEIHYEEDKITENLEDFQINICQDGKFAATFDTGKFFNVGK